MLKDRLREGRHKSWTRLINGLNNERQWPLPMLAERLAIQVEHADLLQGERVLLLDDIAKSGVRLVACRELLYEAGAEVIVDVQ